jgi:hypothetical protein
VPETSPPPTAPATPDPSPGHPLRKRWQVGLQTLFLLMAAIAVWITVFVNRRHNAWLQGRITAIRPVARQLIVEDPAKIAVVKQEEYWYDENRWELYLPPGRSYRLCLATRDVDQDGLAPPVQTAPLPPGRHLLALDQEQGPDSWRLTASWDQTGRLTAEEPREWNPSSGSMGGGQHSICTQLPPDQPLILFRRRFTRPDGKGSFASPDGPCEGILLWIEPISESKAEP